MLLLLYIHNATVRIHIQIYAEHNQIQWRTSMNERTRFFIKIYLSQFILERVMVVVCERWVEDGDRLLFWPKVLLVTIAALLPHLGWGCSTMRHRWPQALSLQADSHAGILSPTDSNRPRHLVILLSDTHLLPLFFRLFALVHLLIDGSVEGEYITLSLGSRVCSYLVIWKVKVTNEVT